MILPFAIALGLVSFTSCFTRIQAQPSKQVVSTVRFDPPPLPAKADRGAPSGRQQGGASRGLCPKVDKPPLTALVPSTQTTLGNKQGGLPGLTTFESVWGLTATESLTLWFYVPYSLTPNLPIEFVLQDEQGEKVYETFVPVSETSSGIVKFRVPSTTPLEMGKMYHWFFSINCVPGDPVFVEGWVQRVAPNSTLASQLQKATPRESIALYAANGYWYDALTTLAELRSANPRDATLSNDWVSLLHSVKLDAIAQEPIVQCCTVEK